MINSVIFDMDGVLFDTETISDRAWIIAAEKLGIGDIGEAVRDCVGMNSKDIEHYFRKHYGEKFPQEEFLKVSRQTMKDIISKEGLPVKKGLYEVLEFLKGNGFRIALATSTSRESTESHLKMAGIGEYFDAIVTGDTVKRGKPDPEIYRRAVQELGATEKECIAVEDSYNGIRSASRAGLKVIMIPDRLPPVPETDKLLFARLDSLNQLITFISETKAEKFICTGLDKYSGIFDTHSHYTDKQFENDRYDVIDTLLGHTVKHIMIASTTIEDSLEAIELTKNIRGSS